MRCRVVEVSLHVVGMRTRMPFRYGIATLTALPHLFVHVEALVDGERVRGTAADGLPPKWFTKDPEATFESELTDMLAVIQQAADLALEQGEHDSAFDLWLALYRAQREWAESAGHPPLLFGFGVSLVERALIEACCRAARIPFFEALRGGALGVQPGALHPELEGVSALDLLPAAPLRELFVRHTVGLSDPLTAADVSPGERVADGLPHTLEECVRDQGLTYFKIKLGGQGDEDLERLLAIARLLESTAGDYRFTLDGNEQYADLPSFQEAWAAIEGRGELAGFLDRLLFVEQPLHRSVALLGETAERLQAWTSRPPMIIDESDATLSTAREALDSGYVGTSHKNCKGVFKGVANACLIARRRELGGRGLILSGEDLCNVGPIALPQDLAVLASLGVTHAERNGQHYFRGLSMFPEELQRGVLVGSPGLYERHAQGFATLRVHQGRLDLDSVLAAPFGAAVEFDPTWALPLSEWDPGSLRDPGAG